MLDGTTKCKDCTVGCGVWEKKMGCPGEKTSPLDEAHSGSGGAKMINNVADFLRVQVVNLQMTLS